MKRTIPIDEQARSHHTPRHIYEFLELWADRQGRPTASLIAFIVETAVLEAKKKGEVPPGSEDPKSDK
ncbi:hypothetical protein QT971_09695 [Microcoleus sp. herbarium19]|uniref:ribbon-helix-helix domain-containing protein n=1 Tax=unclassified Microcoleus TaxID=2642155 RepID=UPI002FD63435